MMILIREDVDQWLSGVSDALLVAHGLEPEMMMLLPLEDLVEITQDREIDPVLRAFVSGVHYARLAVTAGTNGMVLG